MTARARALALLAGLVALAAALRVWALDAVPTPSGDEGNWTWIAYDVFKHRAGAALPPDARFVSMAFAHMIAGAYALLGVSFASARAVCVAGVLAGMVAAYAAAAGAGLRRAGLCVAAVMAVHPWSVAWSRTVTVPYALGLATAVVGPLVLLAALRARTARGRAVGLVLAAQVLCAGVHFSPLALVALGASALYVLGVPRHRAVLRTPAPWVALALGALHLIPVLRGALAVAERGSTRPNHQLNFLAARLESYARTVLGGLGGEATLRHFTGTHYGPALEAVVIAGVLGVIALAARGAWRARGATARDAADELRALALVYLAFALVAVPAVLAPARPWNLPAIDAERYLFALLAPFALLLGALAERDARRERAVALGVVLYLLLGPTARGAWAFARGGGPDTGFYLLRGGGGYRGWKVAREREALPWLIRDEVVRAARGAPATIVVADYAFHPLHFANAETGYPTVDVTKFPLPRRAGQRCFFVLWSDGLFRPGFWPALAYEANAQLRARMRTEFVATRLVRRFEQPNGAPLIELWTGVER